MNQPERNTAVLIFSQSAAREVASKRLLNNSAGNFQLIRLLQSRVYQTVQISGLPFFCTDELTQIGTSFGERITNAIQDIFDQGYQRVIAIGNDCPELQPEDLRFAADQLLKGKCVIGPNIRKGTYLIGLDQSSFIAEEFMELPWQSNQLLLKLKAYFDSIKTSVKVLRDLRDLNSFADLKRLLWSCDELKRFCRIIRTLIQSKTHQAGDLSYFRSLISIGSRQLRAPPIC